MSDSKLLKDGSHQYGPSLVDLWDRLIDWEKRQTSENGFFIDLLKDVRFHRILDVAAGTGFHSVCLMQAGFDVLSCDGSEEMLEYAIENGNKRGLQLKTLVADWRELDSKIEESFDAIICLGSSFPHLFDEGDRIIALQSFYSKLKQGGMLILDHRNFDAIRAHQYRSSGNYYYCGTGVQVSVDHIDEMLCRFRYHFKEDITHHLEVYPILTDELRDLLSEAGFKETTTYGDFKEEFDVFKSDFIIHTAIKP